MDDCTIHDAKAAKEQAENRMAEILRRFEMETGLAVEAIKLEETHHDMVIDGKPETYRMFCGVTITVRL